MLYKTFIYDNRNCLISICTAEKPVVNFLPDERGTVYEADKAPVNNFPTKQYGEDENGFFEAKTLNGILVTVSGKVVRV